MRGHGSDSSVESIRYTRRTPRPPGSSRTVDSDTDSEDSSRWQVASARLRGGQQPPGDLLPANRIAAGTVSTNSIQLGSKLPQVVRVAAAPHTADDSLDAQQQAHRTHVTAPHTMVRMTRIKSSEDDDDAPLTFSRSVTRAGRRSLQATAAQSDSSSESACDTFRRSVPRRPRPNVLADSDSDFSPLAHTRQQAQLQTVWHAENVIYDTAMPGAPHLGSGTCQYTHRSAEQRQQSADGPVTLAAVADGAFEVSTSKAPVGASVMCMDGSNSSGSSSGATSVAVELQRLMLSSVATRADAFQDVESLPTAATPGDIAAAPVSSLLECRTVPSTRTERTLVLKSDIETDSSPGVCAAGQPQLMTAALGAVTVLPCTDTERDDSTPGVSTARRSARRTTRRFLLADSDTDTSPVPAHEQHVTRIADVQMLQTHGANGQQPQVEPALTSAAPLHSTPFGTSQARALPPEWMTSARRPARVAADSLTCSLYAAAPDAGPRRTLLGGAAPVRLTIVLAAT